MLCYNVDMISISFYAYLVIRFDKRFMSNDIGEHN